MNILSSLPDSIPISEINLSGTHDSATTFCSFDTLSRCQDTTVEEQLSMGVRMLDIRLYRKRGEYYLCHAVADCYTDGDKRKKLRFTDVLRACEAFLHDNPREFILMSIKQDRGLQSKRFFPPLYEKHIENSPLWYTENRVPTLGECRGKIVLMRRCYLKKKYTATHHCGLDFSYWEDQDKPLFDTVPVILSGDTTATVQDRYRLPPKEKWESCAKPFLDSCEVSDKQIALHFLSTSSKGISPLSASREINPKFLLYPLKSKTGWILTDFTTEEIVKKIMTSNTGGKTK